MQSTKPHSAGCFKHLFDKLEDAVVRFELRDGSPVIIDANDTFVDVFGCNEETVVDKPLNDLIVPSTKREEARRFDQRTHDGESNAAIVERMTDAGKRKFVYRGVPYGNRYGFAIYSDITAELQQERRLKVLHRVLRHNLRNDLTLILGMATNIIETTDEKRTKQAAKKIKHTANDITRLSDEATTIEDVLGDSMRVEPVELQPLVNSVAANCRGQFKNISITTDIPAGLSVGANGKLQVVLRSLLDNAIRHNGSADRRATVSATVCDPDGVEVTVADNGPGIPRAEQRLLTGDKEVTQLTHSSGLGLWLVKWVVDAYGGDIDIETPTGGGSIVRLRLNRCEDT